MIQSNSYAKKNMLSAYAHPEVVAQQLEKDCEKGFTLGPLTPTDVHTSRIGVIPKKYQEAPYSRPVIPERK